MSELLVYTYNTEDKASEVLKAVVAMKQEHLQKPLIAIEDAAVVVKNAKGKVKIKQTLESAVKGGQVASGGLWGMLIGFLFGGPLFGALLGVGLSALFGRNIDLGIDNAFIKDVSNELSPGDSALFLLVVDTPVEKISGILDRYGGNLYHSSFSKQAEEAMLKAIEHQPLAVALEQEQA